MNYSQAKAHKLELEAAEKSAKDALKKYPKLENGLTPDNVRATPEWKADKKRSIGAFCELQHFNKWFLKRFKAEYLAERRARKTKPQ